MDAKYLTHFLATYEWVVDQIFWLQVVRKRQVVEGLEMTDEVLEDWIGFVQRGSRSDRRWELLLVEVLAVLVLVVAFFISLRG